MATAPVSKVSSAAVAPRTTDLLKVTVNENDPGLKTAATAFGFKVSGTGTNNGVAPSYLTLGFDKKSVSLNVSRGDTGAAIARKLQRALPKGYELRTLAKDGNNVTLGIAKKASTATPAVNPTRIPTSISANMASAQVEASMWVNRMPGPGTGAKKAIATVAVSGTGFADAPPRFTVKSIEVYEAGSHKKVATISSPGLQDQETRRGMKTQNYRLEISESKLDLKKTYTFVVNTGINGSKAAKVRSEYVKVGQAF